MANRHSSLILQYLKDAESTDKPWELWEYSTSLCPHFFTSCDAEPRWYEQFIYRRKAIEQLPPTSHEIEDALAAQRRLISSGLI